MTKRKLKKYIIIAVVLIVLAGVLFYIFVWNKPKVEADVNTVVFPTTACQRVGDDYFYISGKSVKCFSGGEEKTVYEGTEPYRICADEQHLFVCDSGIVCVELESGKSNTIIYAKDQDVWHIYADNGCLFYKIAGEQIKCLDIKTDETKDAIELLNDKSEGFHKQRFSDDKWIIASLTGGELASFEICDDDMTLLFTTSDKSGGFVEKGNELLKAKTDNNEFKCQYFKSDGTEFKAVVHSTPVETTGEATIIGNNVFAVLTTIKQPFSLKGGDNSYLPQLENHYYDTYIKVNTDDFKLVRHETKKYERIIYANNNKVVTYYNSKYLTYSADDWKVTDEKKADEIKDGGKYTFEACGEYVFVFDDDTGECINRIKI